MKNGIGPLCLAAQRNSIVVASQPPRKTLTSQQSTQITPPRTTTKQFTSFTNTVMLHSAVVTNTQTTVAVTASKCIRLHVRRKYTIDSLLGKISRFPLASSFFFRDCIRGLNDRNKIQENRGLWSLLQI